MVKISKVPTPKGEDINSLIQSHEPGVLNHLLGERQLLVGEEVTLPASESKPNTSKLDTSNPSLLTYQNGSLLFTLLGGVSESNIERLRVTLKVERHPHKSSFHSLRHSFDLYNDDQLERYARKASDKLDIGSNEMRGALYELVEAVESYRLERLSLKEEQVKRELSEAQKQKAIEYLSNPNLLRRTNIDIGRTGVVGERINRLLVYLCFTSRLRETPLHVVTLGGSGTGKTYLQEKIGALIPDHEVIQCTASTDNAFYYIKNGDLRNKLILIEDLDGAEGVMYILRELMSKKMVSKLVTQKDPSGKMQTIRVKVHGPISLAATTTRERLYEDNANRSLMISPDNSTAQMEAIMEQQRKLSAGQINEQEQEQLRSFFKDVQSMLDPIKVRNPYAEQLRIPKECFKPLRTHAHYLHFIEAITFYHQYQRERKQDPKTNEWYIETTLEDIEAANALIKEVLLRKSDELGSKSCRDFYERLKKWLSTENKSSFSGSEIRKNLRMAPTNSKPSST